MESARRRMTPRISALTGHWPKSVVQATLSRPRSASRLSAARSGSSGRDSGSRSSTPSWAANSSRVSATVRPIGPSTEIGVQPSWRPSIGTSPGDGRKPTTPQIAAGIRSEPPVSEPVQIGSMSQASAAAEPPDEPPAIFAGSNGLPVAPQTGLRELAPAPNSGTLVLAVTMAPAARTSATCAESRAGTWSRYSGEPWVVSRPSVSCRSLTPTGRPCSRPRLSPRRTAASASRASARARG